MQKHLVLGCALISAIFLGSVAQAADRVHLTFLHTNDLHSHFRSEKTPLKQGGLARLRTAVKAARAMHPNSLLVDGGDWSEGTIYYTENIGVDAVQMMDLVGYDAAVVGNHDWFNGPGSLIDAINGARSRITFLGINFDTTAYDRAGDFNQAVRPYLIKAVGGVRVALIGLTNYEETYQTFLAPVRATDPVEQAAQLSAELKAQGLADVVVGVSHNDIGVNREILRAAPQMDLILGGHDHVKLTKPVVVERDGAADAWIVESGKWAQGLGQLEISYVPGQAGSLELESYALMTIDRSVAEDTELLARVAEIESRIERRMGPIFHDHVADCEVDLHNGASIEAMMGDFVTDAYVRATGADVAIDQGNLIYGELHEGPLTSADVFTAHAAVYGVHTRKTWTLHTWEMLGSDIRTALRLVYTWRKINQMGWLAFSGFSIVFDPSMQKDKLGAGDLFGWSPSPVSEMLIGGQAIDPDKTYKFVAGTGIIEALKFINQKYIELVPLKGLTDTGIESWQAVRDYARGLGKIRATDVAFGGRVRTVQADLAVAPGSLRWAPLDRAATGAAEARVEATVQNYGTRRSSATLAAIDGSNVTVPALEPGQSARLEWERVSIAGQSGVYPVVVTVTPAEDEANVDNNSATRVFELL